jgi:LacI family transcriptional regulator
MVSLPRHRQRAVTLQDLARRAKVSPTTASLALNDHPRVAERTRQRVAAVAQRIGFHNGASYAARRLARSRTQSRIISFDQVGFIYLVGPEKGDLDLVCLANMRGAEHALAKLRACLVFVRVEEREDWEKVERLAYTGVVDGWLITGAVNDAIVNRLNALRLPHVILGDHRCARGPVHCATINHAGVARLALEHVAALGHRRIAFVGGSMRYVYQEQMRDGFVSAQRELGLDTDPRLSAHAPFWDDLDPHRVRQWLDDFGASPPTAIFAGEFRKTELLLKVLRSIGVDVPRQISLISYEAAANDFQVSDLTRVVVPLDEMGRQAALMLHKIVTDGSQVESSEIRLAPTLIQGWSTVSPS